MDVWDFMLCVCTLLVSVIPSCSSYSYCYYSYTSGYYCSYYSYYYYGNYGATSRILGAAVGGGISLIVAFVVMIMLCRFCRGRRASQGTTFTTGQPITTVMNASEAYNMPYYPQQPGQQVQYPYGQPVQQTQNPYPQPVQQTQEPYPQPQQPMGGYPNMAYNPPSYEQAAYQSKPTVPATAPTV